MFSTGAIFPKIIFKSQLDKTRVIQETHKYIGTYEYRGKTTPQVEAYLLNLLPSF
jgi:hypothetical protein